MPNGSERNTVREKLVVASDAEIAAAEAPGEAAGEASDAPVVDEAGRWHFEDQGGAVQEPGAAAEEEGAYPGKEGSSWPDLLRYAAGCEPSGPGGVGAGAAGADATGADADDTDAEGTDAEGTDAAGAEDLFGEADEHTLAPADTADTPAGAIPVAVACPGPSAIAAILPPPSRHARPDELDALAAAARPAARLSVDAGGSDFVVNDASSLLRLDGLCFALILLHSSLESATVLATGVCRRLRQEHEQLYRRYCRVAVRRLERKSSRVNNGVPLSELAPSDAVPAAQLTGPARRAGDGLSAKVWVQVQALVGEARATSFLLSDACAEEEAPWRLRVAMTTLRNEAKTGAYQVQTFAAPPDKLVVVAENFNALAEEDKLLLLESGVVRRVETRVGAMRARVTITPSAKPAPKPIAADVDLSSQLAACQQQEKVLRKQLDELKMRVRTYWSPGKVPTCGKHVPPVAPPREMVVPGEGSVTLAKGGSTGHLRVTYTCAGEAAFRAALDKKDRERLAVAFERPAPRLHVRGEAVGDEHGKPRMTMKMSGRALTASMGGVGSDDWAGGGQSLPTHAMAARRGFKKKRRLR